MKFTPVRLRPTLRASCVPTICERGFQGCANSWECAAVSAARTMFRLGLSMGATLRHSRGGWRRPACAAAATVEDVATGGIRARLDIHEAEHRVEQVVV